MADKKYPSRVQHKSGTTEEWGLATNFTPLEGELLVYTDAGGTDDSGKSVPQLKIGDGQTLVANLPFVGSKETEHASSAETAKEAEHATSADQATNANHATSADTAGTAQEASKLTNGLKFKANGEDITNGTFDGSSATSINFKAGSNVTLTRSDRQIEISSSVPAAGNSLGGVKTGGDVTISSGIITVTDDSHNHIISNVDGLESALDSKSDTGHTHTITANATEGVFDLTGTNGTNAVTYSLAPYSSSTATNTWVGTSSNAGKFYLGTVNPSLTTRLNYNGHLYAKKLYSNGSEVSVSGHGHAISDITNLGSTLDGKASSNHSHTITATATDGIFDLTGTSGTNGVTYALEPYSATTATSTWIGTDGNAGKFYLGSNANPSKTTRLNYNGYLYATKLYSGGSEVSISGHKHAIGDITNLQTTLDGKASTEHDHPLYTNQNAFSQVKVIDTVIVADSIVDTLELAAGDNIALMADANSDKITISAVDTVYTHPTYNAKSVGLYKVQVDGTGHVVDTKAVAKSDITALGIPDSDTRVNMKARSTTKAYLLGTTVSPASSDQAVTSVAETGVYFDTTAGTLVATTFKGALSGNASSSSKLQTARAIDGVSFDGSAAITHYGVCSTAASTTAKTVELPGFTLVTGSRIAVKFTTTNTAANPMLNVNGTGPKYILYDGASVAKNLLVANRVYELVYNGSSYELVSDPRDAVQYKDKILSTNPFGGKSVYISKIDNAFYAAHKRWTVTIKYYNSETDAFVREVSGNASMLFDGGYEGGMQIPAGHYAVIRIDFNTEGESSDYKDTKIFPGYPYGDILLSFYYDMVPASVTAKAYCNLAPNVGWQNLPGSYFNGNTSSTSDVIYQFKNTFYAISSYEFTIRSKADKICSITEIEQMLTRPDPARVPIVSKLKEEKLYFPLTAPEFIGSLTGTATKATQDASGNIITTTYATKSELSEVIIDDGSID